MNEPIVIVGLAALSMAMLLGTAGLRVAAIRGTWGFFDAVLGVALLVFGSSIGVLVAEWLRTGTVGAQIDPSLDSAVAGTAIGGLLAAAYTLALAARCRGWTRLGIKTGWPWGYPLAVALAPVFLFVGAAWVALLDALGLAVEQQLIMQEVLADPTSSTAILTMLYGVVLAPVVEELVFRGLVLMPLVGHLGKWPGAVLSALLFGGLHLSDPTAVVPLTLLGLMLAWLRLRTRSLGPPVLLHLANNGMAFALALSAPTF